MDKEQKYEHQRVEAKWRQVWLEEKTYQPQITDPGSPGDPGSSKKPFYNLMMFPYPSAEGLHVGNMYAFTGADVYGRYQRMKGNDVLEPMGLDGFGIHSENYAIKIGKNPREQAKVSEAHFYDQLSKIGAGFAWDNRLETYDPDYYKWTQWLFIKMFQAGLAYRKKARVNWCPSCKTVLADEQVEGGVCERCKTKTTFKDLAQWFFKITDYADRLLDDIEGLKWPNKIKTAQRQWIGRKEGINIHYPIVNKDGTPLLPPKAGFAGQTGEASLEVICFTTRPETNFGATFVVMGPEHQLIKEIAAKASPVVREMIEKYVGQALAKTENERIAEGRAKTGVFTGLYAVNRLNNYKLPIYISDFVLGHVGTGAVVGVPGHDLRDFQFAKEMGLPIIRVVVGRDGEKGDITREEQVQEEAGVMMNSEFLDGMEIHEAIKKMMDYHEEQGWGERVFNYHLRDWLISRQRYWGAPIPMIDCPKCGWQTVPEEQLPVLLPDLSDWQPKGDGRGPLENAPHQWLEVNCPKCGGKAKRETDVCDTFLDSSWYFLAYPNLQTKEWNGGPAEWSDGQMVKKTNHKAIKPFSHEITMKWLPVDAYIGGAEHAVLHLLYSRFVWKFLCDQELLPFSARAENESSKIQISRNKQIPNSNIQESKFEQRPYEPEPFPFLYGHGLIIKNGAKMSKSRGNIVNPDEYMEKFGADALRMYLMFIGPYDQGGDFSDAGMIGMRKFVERVWRMMTSGNYEGDNTPKQLQSLLQETIEKVDKDMADFRFNTAIAAIMEFFNAWRAGGRIKREDMLKIVKLLAPLSPYMTEELWARLGPAGNSVHLTAFPEADKTVMLAKPMVIVIQVNGKVRSTFQIIDHSSRMTEAEIMARVMADQKIAKWVGGRKIIKTIYIEPTATRPGLINLVV